MIGKTHVAVGLIAACRRAGRPVAALKPVVSGFDDRTAASSDTGRLLAALGEPCTPAAIAALSPWRFAAPLSPDMAAALEGRTIDADAVIATCRGGLAPDRLTVVEGIGGLMVPLAPGRTVLDLVVALALPIILVAPTALGAISHLLTALEALKHRGLAPAAIVLSETPEIERPARPRCGKRSPGSATVRRCSSCRARSRIRRPSSTPSWPPSRFWHRRRAAGQSDEAAGRRGSSP